VFTPFVSLAAGSDKPGLLDADGSALVIHAKADDYASQPIGGAGDRVACAVIGAR
jgi:Cu-Zn family superoxide dismutase